MIELNALGTLGADAELKTPKNSDKLVIEFNIATRHPWQKDDQGKAATIWVRCSYWIRPESKILTHLTKGTKLFVKGVPSAHAWNGDQGIRTQLQLNVKELHFAG